MGVAAAVAAGLQVGGGLEADHQPQVRQVHPGRHLTTLVPSLEKGERSGNTRK